MVNPIKKLLINLFIKFIKQKAIEQKLSQWLKQKQQSIPKLINQKTPYFDSYKHNEGVSNRDDIVFITGRFRSGSTLLWNMFRQLPSCTSYYEPFNERQWFNPNIRGESTDKTHLNVSDYWQEYEGLQQLSNFYEDNWIKQSLHMDEKSFDPNMKSYICELIAATNLRPILQFNRIDFRLPWIKQTFPNAKIIHIYRNPRDQWISTLSNKNSSVKENFEDDFYLDMWCQDLQHHFPFLNKQFTEHPYQKFYYLWKLSYLYGCKYSDLSIQFEQLTTNSELIGKQILKTINLDANFEKFTKVIKQPILNKWQSYADERWFYKLEYDCDQQLSDFFSSLNRYKLSK